VVTISTTVVVVVVADVEGEVVEEDTTLDINRIDASDHMHDLNSL